jgi:TolA-binding protein
VRDQSKSESLPEPDRPSRRERNLVLVLLAVVSLVTLGIYLSIPVKEEHNAIAAPDPTAQAIHDVQTSLQQVVDQLRALQQTTSSDRAKTAQLSDQVNALSGKIEALQQSFASSQQAPVALVPTEPLRLKRGPR